MKGIAGVLVRGLGSVAIVLACLALAACGRVDEPTTGMYRALLELPGGDAPFGLEVERASGGYVLYLHNGSERTRVSDVTVQEGVLTARFPGYENSLRATLHRNEWKGAVTLIKAGGEEQVIPFRARLGQSYRFYDKPATDNADVAGRWELTLTDDEGVATRAVAEFEQHHDKVTGTVMTPTGDHRFLDGQVHGDELQLSTFAGGLVYLYRLRVDEAGELRGDYWQGLAWHEQVHGVRNPDAELPADLPVTTMREHESRLEFTFPDLDGKPISLSDERFAGKVVIVTLGGSWCPNCHDEADFLAPFYREYRDRGVEVVALMFERHGDFAKAAAAARRFRDDLGIEYPMLIADVSDKDEASRALPSLSGIFAFPTLLFVDRTGVVRKTHVGFAGPATGSRYETFVADFHATVDALLAEPGVS